MGFPLPLGIQSRDELCDIDLFADVPANFFQVVNTHLPEGIKILSFEYLEKTESIMAQTVAAEYVVDVKSSDLIEKIKNSIEQKIIMVKKSKKGEVEVDFEKAILDFKIENEKLILKLSLGNQNSIRIDQALMKLGDINLEELVLLNIVKQRQFREDGTVF